MEPKYEKYVQRFRYTVHHRYNYSWPYWSYKWWTKKEKQIFIVYHAFFDITLGFWYKAQWQLSDTAFDKIVSSFGLPDIDLVASKANRKCRKYIIWLEDRECVGVDALRVDWKIFYFYAFHPFPLILRVLQKIIRDRVRGIVVLPPWSSQQWYPLFCWKKELMSFSLLNICFLLKGWPTPLGTTLLWWQGSYLTREEVWKYSSEFLDSMFSIHFWSYHSLV